MTMRRSVLAVVSRSFPALKIDLRPLESRNVTEPKRGKKADAKHAPPFRIRDREDRSEFVQGERFPRWLPSPADSLHGFRRINDEESILAGSAENSSN